MPSDLAGEADKLPRRVPLTRSRRRLNFERRIRLWLWVLSVPCFGLCSLLLYKYEVEPFTIGVILFCLLISWAFAVALFMDEITRPLQTLSNVVAALRADDYSFRARGGRRNDSIGDLAIELNKLADMLQAQRVGALEAQALVDRVMSAIQSPVLAFDPQGKLRLFNIAAQQAFRLQRKSSIGKTAEQLELAKLIQDGDAKKATVQHDRWMVNRGTFRLSGVPHSLFVLSDIGAALQQEERVAWERLVRVLGHEINNSLTPIKSIAGSLRQQMAKDWQHGELEDDLRSGLEVIEDRADSLNRFLRSYRQLLGLPAPVRKPVSIAMLVHRIAQLETRLHVAVIPNEDKIVSIDEDQTQQALINLVRNAVEAALSPDAQSEVGPEVTISWSATASDLIIVILDTGPGLSNASNLFVPFYTTKETGSGIGLALAQQIAQAHKGTVRLVNRADSMQGCRAEFQIPFTD